MTTEQRQVIETLRDEGYAVTIFTPEELKGAKASKVEDWMVEQGWEIISAIGQQT